MIYIERVQQIWNWIAAAVQGWIDKPQSEAKGIARAAFASILATALVLPTLWFSIIAPHWFFTNVVGDYSALVGWSSLIVAATAFLIWLFVDKKP